MMYLVLGLYKRSPEAFQAHPGLFMVDIVPTTIGLRLTRMKGYRIPLMKECRMGRRGELTLNMQGKSRAASMALGVHYNDGGGIAAQHCCPCFNELGHPC